MSESAHLTPDQTALEPVSYGRQLTIRAASDPHGTALIVVAPDGTDTSYTWSELECGANQWARAFGSVPVRQGDVVALSLPNSYELVVAALAIWKVGATPIPMRWDLPEWEQKRLLDVIEPALVLTEDNAAAWAERAGAQVDTPPADVISPAVSGICSSGSTGLPKVILNTAPAAWTADHAVPFIAHWAPVSQPQTILVPAPMYHTNGFVTLNFLLGGDRLVLLEKFNAAVILDTIEKHRITTFTATPTMLSRIADVRGVEQRDLSSIEWILQGAAVMPEGVLRRWFDLLSPEQVVMAYGMTENLGLTALRGEEWLTRPGSVGRGFRDTEIRVLDDNGGPVAAGEFGEIYLRAPMNDQYRYIGGAQQLPRTADDFASAGDIGYLDADGFLFIADRRTDMIVSGGANVFPAEVESALIEHPAITDVVVIGLADQQWGRRVHAVVQAVDITDPPSEDDVIQFARSRLAAYKVPKTVELVDQIPRSEATKVNRSAMVQARGG